MCPRCRTKLWKGPEDSFCQVCGYHDWVSTAAPRPLKERPPYYTLAEAAAEMRVSVRTLRGWCEKGVITDAVRKSNEERAGDTWLIPTGAPPRHVV